MNHLLVNPKQRVYDYYDHCCQVCGESDPSMLCLDHVNDDGADERAVGLKGLPLCRAIIKYNLWKRYQLLCFNHNRKKEYDRTKSARGRTPVPPKSGKAKKNVTVQIDTWSYLEKEAEYRQCYPGEIIDALVDDRLQSEAEVRPTADVKTDELIPAVPPGRRAAWHYVPTDYSMFPDPIPPAPVLPQSRPLSRWRQWLRF